jgi:hypothetical protein
VDASTGWFATPDGFCTAPHRTARTPPSTFARIERAWTTTYRGRAVRTSDYVDLAGQVAGQDLHDYLDCWLYSATVPPMPGHPDSRALPAG